MKYLNLFDDHNEYLEYLESEDFTYPNISYCYQESHIHFNKSDIIITAEFIVNDIQNPIKIYGYNDDPVKQYSFIFYGVEHFDEITVNGNIVSIEELDENEGMFQFNDTGRQIVTYKLKNKKGYLDDGCFQYCNYLTSVTIPNTVTTIGNSAFVYCSHLEEVISPNEDSLPNSIKVIGENAFNNCMVLNITLPEGLEYIQLGAFAYCNSLTNITIPNTVKSIGDSCFRYCSHLESIVLSTSIKKIPDTCFFHCESLESINIPNGVTEIGESAFSGCNYLTTVTIPNTVKTIKNDAFYQCEGLSSITLPNITELQTRTFYGCRSLTDIVIPSSVNKIGIQCFENCTSFEQLTIPNTVLFIERRAFMGCSSLESVVMLRTKPCTLWNANAFDNTNDCPIYVPEAGVEQYKNANNWSALSDRIVANVK